MALIKPLLGHTPQFGKNIWLADNCTIIGDVVMGDDCNVWFNAVIRGDVHYIRIGNRVNIQDNACLHATFKTSPLNIGNNVSIAHNAIVHGCTIKDNVLIGMGAIVMDDAVIEENCIVAAGAVVTKGTKTEKGSVYAGCPAKKIKDVDETLQKDLINRIVDNYAMYADWYR
ncbi:MAG: gamma carbonic anhydrase family protein [Bacteroidales bacterium]|nr:gamma carbonic anhydrase family protein [Bacteroidales bacterium]